jgi:hypothetical protein
MKHQDGLGKVAQVKMAFLTDQNFGDIDCPTRLYRGARIVFLPHRTGKHLLGRPKGRRREMTLRMFNAA